MSASSEQLAVLRATLLNSSGKVSLAARFRSLFTLRSLKSDDAVVVIGEAFETATALLGHELAYVLGQMGRESALPILESVLRDVEQHPMVRHEAGEAMGAISSPTSLPILKEFVEDSNISIRETCQLAICKIVFDERARKNQNSPSLPTAGFNSVDPAPPINFQNSKSSKADVGSVEVEEMGRSLLNDTFSLFDRYRAMFGLRNAVVEASDVKVQVNAVLNLAKGFEDKSALFRHEIAYIFGQLSHPASVPSLLSVLRNGKEDEMVRHEAAEALGSIASPEVLPALKQFADKSEKSDVVRESCEVALDMVGRA